LRTITLDNLVHRGFGEALYSDRTPEDREAALLSQDIDDLNGLVDNREEMMSAQLLLSSQVTLRQYADKAGTDEYLEMDIKYFDGPANPNAYTPAYPWNGANGAVYQDLTNIVRQLSAKGSSVTDIVAHPSVIDFIIADAQFQRLLDVRNYELGKIVPVELPEGVGFYGNVVLGGHTVGLYSYDREVVDDISGATTPVIPEGSLVACAPGCGRTLYGAISQIEEDDRQWHTYASRRVPKFFTDSDNDVRTLRVAARPLPAPVSAYPWVSASVLA
jgi:hypothetical protein